MSAIAAMATILLVSDEAARRCCALWSLGVRAGQPYAPFALIREVGLPEPQLRAPVLDYRLDLHWPETRPWRSCPEPSASGKPRYDQTVQGRGDGKPVQGRRGPATVIGDAGRREGHW